jgi:hypothetical protein
MKRRHAALTTLSGFAGVTLAAALLVLFYSCNFMMPSASYPVIRQEKGFRLLRSASIDDIWFRGDIKIIGAVLDGISSRDAIYNDLGAYLAVEAEDSQFDGFLHIDPFGLRFVERNSTEYEAESMAQGPDQGFWALRDSTNEIVRIINNGSNQAEEIIPIITYNLSTLTSGGVSALWMDWDQPPGTVPPDTYRAVFINGAAIEFGSDSTPLSGAVTADFSSPTARTDIAASFVELTAGVDPFWNDGRFEFRRFGFSSTAEYSWFAVRRFDAIRGIEEMRTAAIRDLEPTITRTVPGEPEGNAGGVLIVRQESEPPGIKYSLMDGSLTEYRKITVYGDDAHYLGDALEHIDGVPTNIAVFASISVTGGSNKDSGRRVTVSLWAHRADTLAEGE